MSTKNTPFRTSIPSLPVLDILDEAGVCFSIKGSNLEFIYQSKALNKLLGIAQLYTNDFEIFIPEIAYEIAQEDSLISTSGVAEDVDRILITKKGKELVVRIKRSIVNHEGGALLVTIYTDITKQTQNKQFEAYKKVLTDGEVFEKMLNRFSQRIFSSQSRKDVFNGVGKLCLDLLDLENLSIYLMDREVHVLRQVKILINGEQIWFKENAVDTLTISIDEGVVGRCARTKTTLIIDDVHLDPEYIQGVIEYKSELAVPIIYHNEVLGVLDTESTLSAKYTNKTKRIIEGLASLLAIKLNEIQSKEYLEAKNEQLYSLVKNNLNAIAMLDNEGNYIQVSDDWMRQFVSSKHDTIIGLNHFELNPNIPSGWKELIKMAYEGKPQVVHKEVYKKRSGEVVFFKGTVNPWFLKKGEVGGIILQADDITESVNDEVNFLKSKEELEEAKFIGQLVNWEIDIEKDTIQVDTGRQSIPGLENGRQYDLNTFFQFKYAGYQADLNQSIERALSSNGVFSLIHPFKVKSKVFWMDNKGKVITENGAVIQVKGTAHNITDQIDAENANKQKNIELKQLNVELDQFVYKTAHDLRAPLANILGIIDLMRMEENPKILATYFDLQEKSVSRLDAFIQKITNYAKNTRLPLTKDNINFDKIVDGVLKDHMFIAGSDKVLKKLNVDKSKSYYSDSERITIILNNLIANAIKFRDDKKENSFVEIDVKLESKYIHICVRDNGIGISNAFKDKVFDMFYRAHKTADGSGIGLYIVRETVRKLGGSILLKTEEGAHTEFNIFLPNSKF
jgi:PAS domain S-box-containing protein